MEEHPRDPLEILGQLAREYEKKHQELQEAVTKAQPEIIPAMLGLRGEMTTDRFRAAQMALLTMLSTDSAPKGDDMNRTLITLCRCFDEMRILFEILLDHFSKSKDSNCV